MSTCQGCAVEEHGPGECANRDLYDELYGIWKDSYTALEQSGYYERLNKFQLENS